MNQITNLCTYLNRVHISMNNDHSFVLLNCAEIFNRLLGRTKRPANLLHTKYYTLLETLPFDDFPNPILVHVHLAGFNLLSFKNSENVLKRFVNTSKKFMDISGRVAGNVATDPIIMHTVAHSKTIWDHRGKATQTDSRTSKCAGGQDVVVNGCISWVLVQTWHRHSFRICQVA